MPVDKQVFLRYQVLNRCFRDPYGEYTIEDLVEKCNKALRKADLQDVSKRTIQNDISKLEADYHILLDEDLKKGRQRIYRYVDTSFSLKLFRVNDQERYKIQDAISVLGKIEGDPLYEWARMLLMQVESGLLSEDSSPVVSFQSNPDLEGVKHFEGLLKAIVSKRVLKIKYTPYGKPTYTAKIYPYHLKQFNDRWYLIARTVDYEGLTNYALDRIEDFEEIAIPYVESDVDFNEYFDDVIGVTVPDAPPEDIVIKVSKKRFNYIKTKPLHLTQHAKEFEDYAIITINVKVNNELEALLLSFGSDVEVLSPASLRTRIAEKIKSMNQLYTDENG